MPISPPTWASARRSASNCSPSPISSAALPNFDNAPTPTPLKVFPNAVMIENANTARTNLGKQASDALEYVVELNRSGHELLVPASLPRVASDKPVFDFRFQYNEMMNPGGKPAPFDRAHPERGPVNLIELLRATQPATQQDIQIAMGKKWSEEFEPRVILTNGQPVNRDKLVQEFIQSTQEFVPDFYKDRAARSPMYIEPEALTRAEHIARTDTPSIEEIWYAQMMLWMEQDACQAIHDINIASRSVADSPVKNLESLLIKQKLEMYYTSANAAGATPGARWRPRRSRILRAPPPRRQWRATQLPGCMARRSPAACATRCTTSLTSRCSSCWTRRRSNGSSRRWRTAA